MPTSASLENPRSRASSMASVFAEIRVAAPGRREDLVLVRGDTGLGLPRGAVALEVRHERGIDVALVHGPDEQRRHEAAVLTHPMHHVVARPGQHDVAVDARQLLDRAQPPEQMIVGLGLPRPEAGTRPGAARASLLPVAAVSGTELVLEVERLVAALHMVVADDVVRTGITQPAQPVQRPVVMTSS